MPEPNKEVDDTSDATKESKEGTTKVTKSIAESVEVSHTPSGTGAASNSAGNYGSAAVRPVGRGDPAQLSREQIGDDMWTVAKFMGSVVILGAIFTIIYSWSHKRFAACAAPLLWSLALLAVGALLGFLFAIPKVLQGSSAPARPSPSGTPGGSPPTGGAAGGDAASGGGYQQRVNTNLEEISDWLTKIIVGITLVQFNNIRPYIGRTAELIGASLEKNGDHISFGYALLIFYSISGFLFGYLTTRLYIQAAFARNEGRGDSQAGSTGGHGFFTGMIGKLKPRTRAKIEKTTPEPPKPA